MSKKSSNLPRRELLKSGAGLMGALGVSALLGSKVLAQGAKPAAPAAAPEKLKMTDPQAQALGYNDDAKKVDTKKWTKRAGHEGAEQFCYNCMFFQAKGDPKAAKSAPCTIFSGKLVASNGWCQSWTQNPNVKS